MKERFIGLRYHNQIIIPKNGSLGGDTISVRIIQMCGDSITIPVTQICSFFLQQGVLSDAWKMTIIFPVHKKRQKF